MKSKLTLSVDEWATEQGRRIAEDHGTSLSALMEQLIFQEGMRLEKERRERAHQAVDSSLDEEFEQAGLGDNQRGVTGGA